MINGLDWSSWEKVTDAEVMFNDQLLIDFAIVRGFDGFRDDQTFVENRKILTSAQATTKNGAVLWAPYGFLGYSAKAGSKVWNAVRGDYQMQNMWQLTTAGGREFQLPAAIDVEQLVFVENGVRQTVPFPEVNGYLRSYLIPAIEFLSEKQGRRPILYTNPNNILSFLAPALGKPEFKAVRECPLWIAAWSRTMTQPAAWDKVKAYWDKWLIWQYAGDVKDWPGIPAVDLNRIPGTRAQLKAWMNDPTKPQPAEGAADPEPQDPPTDPQDPPTDPQPSAQLDRIEAKIEKIAKHFAE